MRAFTILGLMAVLLLALPACDGGDPEEPEPEPVLAQFRVASVTITDVDGTEFLQFAARPTQTIELSLVDIENPVGNSVQFNANNTLVAANSSIQLQDPQFGYFRVSGTWTFRFTYIDEGGAGSQRVVTETINVGALREADNTPVASE